MFRRILFTTAAAAALLAAAPAFAAEHAGARNPPCSCCSDGSNHATDHALREANAQDSAERVAKRNGDQDTWAGTGYYGG